MTHENPQSIAVDALWTENAEYVSNDDEDGAGGDPRIEELCSKMEVVENVDYSPDYLDPWMPRESLPVTRVC